jgi:hypothetical protein
MIVRSAVPQHLWEFCLDRFVKGKVQTNNMTVLAHKGQTPVYNFPAMTVFHLRVNSKVDWVQRRQTREETFNRHSVFVMFREIEYYPDSK